MYNVALSIGCNASVVQRVADDLGAVTSSPVFLVSLYKHPLLTLWSLGKHAVFSGVHLPMADLLISLPDAAPKMKPACSSELLK